MGAGLNIIPAARPGAAVVKPEVKTVSSPVVQHDICARINVIPAVGEKEAEETDDSNGTNLSADALELLSKHHFKGDQDLAKTFANFFELTSYSKSEVDQLLLIQQQNKRLRSKANYSA